MVGDTVSFLFGGGRVPNLTELTTTVASAIVGLGSLDLYCVHDNTDYRVSPVALQSLISRKGGAGVLLGSNQSGTQSLANDFSWGSVMYEDGVGWVDLVNSATCLFAPRPMLAMAQLHLEWVNANGTEVGGRILYQNSFDNNLPWASRKYGHAFGTARGDIYMPPTVMASGSLITAKFLFDIAAAKEVNSTCWFAIWPLAYL